MEYKVNQIEDYYKVAQVEDYYKIKMIQSVGLWGLPSKDGLTTMHAILHLSGLGGFADTEYWSSSEFSFLAAYEVFFGTGVAAFQSKTQSYRVRPFRKFIADKGIFRLRDKGPGGGYIYYIDETDYYEAYATDISTSYYWSNIDNVVIGTTGTAIGTGAQNTFDIIAQSGHITSAAELCRLLNPGTFSEWFLGSKDTIDELYTKLYLSGIGDFSVGLYWSSSEGILATNATAQDFTDGVQYGNMSKNTKARVRACRTFRSTDVYALRDIGPGGGYVFYIDGDQYYEENGANLSELQSWSNIANVSIGATAQGTAIGKGILNTAAVIGQTGHTDSAAKLCNDYSV